MRAKTPFCSSQAAGFFLVLRLGEEWGDSGRSAEEIERMSKES